MAGQARQPRAWLKVEGEALPVLSLDVTNTTTRSSDTFSASLALRGNGKDAAFWAGKSSIKCEAVIDDGSGPKTMLEGQADHIEVDFSHGTVHVSGRDKSDQPIEAKTTEKFLNKTASEVAKEIAGRRGLQADVDDTKDKVGTFYGNETAKLTDQDTEWNLLSRLAQREGHSLYITGGKLFFKKASGNQAGDSAADGADSVFKINYAAPTPANHARGNFTLLQVTRNCSLAGEVKVKVKSWNTEKKEGVKAEKTKGGPGSGGAASRQPLTYEYRLPSLTQEQADNIAQQRLDENTKHELTLTCDAPGDTSITVPGKVQLTGTGTDFDQTYFLTTVTHSVRDGYRMAIAAKNKSEGGQ